VKVETNERNSLLFLCHSVLEFLKQYIGARNLVGIQAGGIESEAIPVLLKSLKIPSFLFTYARKQESCKTEWKKDQTKVKYFIFVHGSTPY
jgi:hypothetical protein